MTHPLIETNFTKFGPFLAHGGTSAYLYSCKDPSCGYSLVTVAKTDLTQENETRLLMHLTNDHVKLQGDFPQNDNIKRYIEAGSAGMQHAARQIVQNWYNDQRGDSSWLSFEEVYVVWFAKALQNFKVLASTNVADLRYYEVTFDGDKNKFYLDVYKKEANLELNG